MLSPLKVVMYGLCQRGCPGKADDKKKAMWKGRRRKKKDVENSGDL